VFYSMANGDDGGRYYEVHEVPNMRHELTLLAYEMNDEPLRVLHGAPLRVRCENELGFKQVKWIASIEFVSDFADLGAGQGGYNDDHEFMDTACRSETSYVARRDTTPPRARVLPSFQPCKRVVCPGVALRDG
jgi:DMSO/TMAO reductase YedYZ molybdopterin-dependent catalytic subunit